MSNYDGTVGTNTYIGGKSHGTGDLADNYSNEQVNLQDFFRDLTARVNSCDMESETIKFCIEQSLNGISIANSIDTSANGPQQDKNS